MINGRTKFGVVAAGLAGVAVLGVVLFSASGRWEAAAKNAPVVADGFELRRVRCRLGDRSVDVTAIAFDPRAQRAAIFDLPQGLPSTLQQLRIDYTARIVVNGGYFDSNFKPLGLFKIGGAVQSPVSGESPLSAVLSIQNGVMRLQHADDFRESDSDSAMQCGPFLIDPGGSPGIRLDDQQFAERSVIAFDQNRAFILVTSPASLYEVSQILRQQPDELGLKSIDRAANLDGGPSTGFATNIGGSQNAIEPRGRIRSVIVIGQK